ncbi:MAG: magnesium transporter [Candidatus Bipolaricaulota bacterium]
MREESHEKLQVQELLRRHPADVAEILSDLHHDEALALVQRLYERRRRAAAGPLAEMESEEAARLLSELSRDAAVQILSRMDPDDAADLLAELPAEIVQDVLKRLEREDAQELSGLLTYAPDSAGGLMSPDVVALPARLTCQQAIESLRRVAEEMETVYYAYVVDEDGKLVGVLSLRDLVFAPPEAPIVTVMHSGAVSLPADMDVEEVARTFDKYNYLALPVVSQEGRLLGVVTVDDVIDVIREETTEDFLRMGGIPAGEEDPLTSPRQSIRKRLPWMMANIIFCLVAVIGIAVFEGTIAQVAFLAVLMPIIADMAGNVGSQSMSVTIRGMATGHFTWADRWKALRKEVAVGLFNGLVLGVQLGLITYLWRRNIYLGVIALFTMWMTTLISYVLGSSVPTLLKRLKLDPAMMSGAVVTTVADLLAFFFFLGLATAFIHRL